MSVGNTNHVRAQIQLDTTQEAVNFISCLNSDGSADRYVIEDLSGHFRMNARSFLQVICAMAEFAGNMYLVNDTEDGKLPNGIDDFRP